MASKNGWLVVPISILNNSRPGTFLRKSNTKKVYGFLLTRTSVLRTVYVSGWRNAIRQRFLGVEIQFFSSKRVASFSANC